MSRLTIYAVVMIVVMSVVAPLSIANAQSLVGELPLKRSGGYVSSVGYVSSAAIDPTRGFAYFGTGEMRARIYKIRLSDFSLVDNLTLDPDVDVACSAVIDTPGGFAYFGAFGGNSGICKIVKIRLSDFAVTGAILIDERPMSAVIDSAAGFAYFGSEFSRSGASTVWKVGLSDFRIVQTLQLNVGEEPLTAAVIDTLNGFAYFGSSGKIVKIRLSDFSRADSLKLNPDEDWVGSAVIDAPAGYAYFGTALPDSKHFVNPYVVKVRLSDFTRVGRLALPKADLGDAVIDPEAGFAYFAAGYSIRATIYTIRLSDFTAVGSLDLNEDESLQYTHGSVVIDTLNGFAYFGTTEFPKIVKIQLPKTIPKTSTYTPILQPTQTEPRGLDTYILVITVAVVAAVLLATTVIVVKKVRPL